MAGTASIWIDVPPDVAFSSLADLTRMGEWSPENLGGEWLQVRPGMVGSAFRGRNRGPRGEWETVVTVTEFAPDTRFSFRVAQPGEEGTTWHYSFEPEGKGTRVTESFDWRWTPLPAEGFRGRIGAMPVSEAKQQVATRQGHLQRSAESTLTRLKEALEAPS